MKKVYYYSIIGAIIMLSACGKSSTTPDNGNNNGNTGGNNGGTGGGTPTTESVYLTNAKATHAFIAAGYATPFGSYRVNTTNNTSSAFEWYVASQLYADAAMVASGDASYQTSMNNTFAWLNKLVDKNDPNGGYFAFANLDGSGASGVKYVDDNALTGMAFLDAYDVTSGSTKTDYLTAAQSCAKWLMNSGQWDTTFGGGFWWTTEKTVKPTQSNGLAMQLFARLYKITGNTQYRDWAVSVNDWLNTQMYDSTTGLYIWQIEKNNVKNPVKFTYDNAIMIEAQLLFADAMADNSYKTKAQALGNAMIRGLWDKNSNVFIFNTNDLRINGCYSGWATQAMVKLYEMDNNSNWLVYAKANVDAINLVLKNPALNGYYQYAALNGAGRYTNLEGVDQAWMQRVQTLLAKYR
jgi:uncharacterized protein YyaL (SSP411 family)